MLEEEIFLYLLKPGIADLHEERPVFLQDVDSGISEIIIRIPDEQYRPCIRPVGGQGGVDFNVQSCLHTLETSDLVKLADKTVDISLSLV